MVNKRRVGRTALEVTELGLGGGPIGGNREMNDGAGRAIVAAGYESGLRYFDVAPLYGTGRAEHLVGDVLRERSGWVLSTKVGHILSPRPRRLAPAQGPFPFEHSFDYSYDGAMRSFDASLQRLATGRIDIAYIHDVDIFTHGEAGYRTAFDTMAKGAYRALEELRRTGDILAIGLGVNETRPVAEALQFGCWDCFLLAGRYTLLEQGDAIELLAAVLGHGASIVVGGPFNSGVLVGRGEWNYRAAPAAVVERVAKLRAVCDTHGIPLAAAALQFPLAHPAVASVIPGARSVAELEQILQWSALPIPAALWDELKQAGLIDAAAPVPAP